MGQIHSRHVNGSLAYWEDHRKRIVDAVGSDVVKYIDDFVAGGGPDTAWDAWTVTRVEAGAGESTITSGDTGNGTMLLTTDAADNDGLNCQLLGESFKLESGKPLYFGARIQSISDVTQSDLFIGLAITDTDILGGVTDSIGFQKVDASTDLTFVVNKNSTATTASGLKTLANTTAYVLEFYYDGTNIEVFVDGVSVATPAITNLPDDEELRISVHFLAGEAVAKTCAIDWIRCIKFGRQ
jgi:hypothetical protein